MTTRNLKGSLGGLVALVTGGSRGIGAATCLALAREGADVVISYVKSSNAAQDVAAKVREIGSRAHTIQCDLGSSVVEVKRMVDESAEAMGRLDILVNNAGGSFGGYTHFEEVTEEHYDHIMNVNLKATFFASQAAVPHMRKVGKGRIINFTSELFFIGYSLMTAYTSAKGGVIGLTRSMARDLAPDITVNTIAPGPTATERFKQQRWYNEEAEEHLADIPLRRWGAPEDVAHSVVYLAGPGGDWITGQTINVNGGVVMP